MAWTIYGVFAGLGLLQGFISLLSGIRAWLFARKDLRTPPRVPLEQATVIMPCKGAEATLARTVAALLAQEHSDYELLFVVESADDPACAIIRSAGVAPAGARDAGAPVARLVVAGVSPERSRKVHNLLAGVAAARPESTVLIFMDSDAVPGPLHLARLTTRLHKPHIGATTGYRWYIPSGGLVPAVCCIWNAAALTLLGSHRHNFCWGGSTAIRREVFERVGVRAAWQCALSDDYQLTRCVREAGLGIRFVPGCVVSTAAPSRWRDFLGFAHRQFVITRVCGPRLWTLATIWCALFCGLLASGAVSAVRWL
ncbi:MAG TPA: glycosyltransferase family 2 protein, partial [Phycisphaerae bacterium]